MPDWPAEGSGTWAFLPDNVRTDLTHSPGTATIALPGRRRWTIVGLLFTASLINYFDRATISFALPLISKELHLGPEAKGLLLSSLLLVLHLDADSDGHACRSGEPALALRRGLHIVVGGAGTDRHLDGLTSLIALRILLGMGSRSTFRAARRS